MNPPAATVEEPFVAFIGWDWADQSHALALQCAGSASIESVALVHSAESLHQWLDQLQERFQGQPVAVALEGAKGPVFTVLLERPWIGVFGVHPATTSRYRSAFVPSGAKDDRPDALLLLELLTRHREKLNRLQLADPATRKLDQLCRLRRDVVDRRTQLTNQLTGLLKKYFPQALPLLGEHLYSPLALAFLHRWPSLQELKASRPTTLKRFFFAHNVRSPEAVAARLQTVATARFLTRDPVGLEVWLLELQGLVAQLAVVQKHIEGLDQAVSACFKAHPEAALFRHLPGAGPAMAPRLVAAFGQDRDRYPQPESLQKLAGVAPVLERSGGSSRTSWRRHAPTFLRQTFVEWAKCSVATSVWAAAYYQQQKNKGKKCWAIYRALAFKWIRILWKCWQTRTPYDESRYLQQLIRRRSPLAKALQAAQT